MRKTILNSLLAGTAVLFLVTACADASKDSGALAEKATTEEPRLEQETKQTQSDAEAGPKSSEKKLSPYQAAIQDMMKKKSKDEDSKDKKDGG